MKRPLVTEKGQGKGNFLPALWEREQDVPRAETCTPHSEFPSFSHGSHASFPTQVPPPETASSLLPSLSHNNRDRRPLKPASAASRPAWVGPARSPATAQGHGGTSRAGDEESAWLYSLFAYLLLPSLPPDAAEEVNEQSCGCRKAGPGRQEASL